MKDEAKRAELQTLAQNVKITPLGSHAGELCANDRAIVFEDPTGVRFLYRKLTFSMLRSTHCLPCHS